MEILKWCLISVIFIFEIILLIFACKTKKPILAVFLNSLSGIISIIIINLTEKYTGCHIPINPYSVGFTALYGIPAATGLLVVKFLFI